MKRLETTLKRLAAGAAFAGLAALAGTAQAVPVIDARVDFDNVAAGSAANDALGAYAGAMRFANPDIERDVDASGSYTDTFHWIDATATYGDVRVLASGNATSGTNLLSNDLQPIMLVFSEPVRLASLSIRQDLSGFGNPQADGTQLLFLDAGGHAIAGSALSYTQFGQPGLTLSVGALPFDISAVLFAGGTNYDDLRITTAAPIPEPATAALALAGLAVLALSRRAARAA